MNNKTDTDSVKLLKTLTKRERLELLKRLGRLRQTPLVGPGEYEAARTSSPLGQSHRHYETMTMHRLPAWLRCSTCDQGQLFRLYDEEETLYCWTCGKRGGGYYRLGTLRSCGRNEQHGSQRYIKIKMLSLERRELLEELLSKTVTKEQDET